VKHRQALCRERRYRPFHYTQSRNQPGRRLRVDGVGYMCRRPRPDRGLHRPAIRERPVSARHWRSDPADRLRFSGETDRDPICLSNAGHRGPIPVGRPSQEHLRQMATRPDKSICRDSAEQAVRDAQAASAITSKARHARAAEHGSTAEADLPAASQQPQNIDDRKARVEQSWDPC
jgi:hypothetical protein